jgi:hypothetical protein
MQNIYRRLVSLHVTYCCSFFKLFGVALNLNCNSKASVFNCASFTSLYGSSTDSPVTIVSNKNEKRVNIN